MTRNSLFFCCFRMGYDFWAARCSIWYKIMIVAFWIKIVLFIFDFIVDVVYRNFKIYIYVFVLSFQNKSFFIIIGKVYMQMHTKCSLNMFSIKPFISIRSQRKQKKYIYVIHCPAHCASSLQLQINTFLDRTCLVANGWIFHGL